MAETKPRDILRQTSVIAAASFLVIAAFIGTGAAGLRAAIELAETGLQVLCVGKRRRDDAHTVLAAGGINAALGTMDPEDTWQQHAADTIAEAYHLADPRVAELLAREAPAAIDDLIAYGAQFAREEDGRLSQRYFGAHTYRRTCFAGDYTGREMQRALVNRVTELGVQVNDDLYITRLLVHEGRVFGAYGFDVDDGTRHVILADAVILAAGGHTRIWRRSSSRRDENTGDAMRLAADAGILATTFAVATLLAELLGAAILGVAISVGSIAYTLVLMYLMLSR